MDVEKIIMELGVEKVRAERALEQVRNLNPVMFQVSLLSKLLEGSISEIQKSMEDFHKLASRRRRSSSEPHSLKKFLADLRGEEGQSEDPSKGDPGDKSSG